MGCIICSNLERALEAGQREYITALCAPYYLVYKKFAAYKNVELQRARNELEDHRSVCALALSLSTPSQRAALLVLVRQEELETNLVQSSA